MTFTQIMTKYGITASSLIAAIKASGHAGTVKNGSRIWGSYEINQIVKLVFNSLN